MELSKELHASSYEKLGKATYEQWVIGILFVIDALLWLFRSDMVFGSFTLPGIFKFWREHLMCRLVQLVPSS